jgi:outer membrane protein OmpA-like peptidoglycan-associated protein
MNASRRDTRVIRPGPRPALAGLAVGTDKKLRTGRQSRSADTPTEAAAQRPQDAARSAGQPLDAAARAAMEPRFGHDFGAVRVHADARAAEAAERAGARAYTLGSDVVFGAGEYQPQSAPGRRLIAHELAHVVQQARGGQTPDAERRAEAAAKEVARGADVVPAALGGAPVSLQAQSKPSTQPTSEPTDAGAQPQQQPSSQPAQAGASQPAVGHTETMSKTLDSFALDSAKLTETHKKDIDGLAFSIALHAGMLANARVTIAISGHTDTSGPDKHNMGLGQDRADAVKDALDKALAGQKLKAGTIAGETSTSFGESKLRIPTKDGVKEPRNRRVEIEVTLEALLPPPPKPKIDLTVPPDILDKRPPPPYRDPKDEDLWKKMEENQRKIDEYDRTHPKESKSPLDKFIDGVIDGLNPILNKLPESLRDLAKKGIRSGIEAGSEKACEAAIDAAGVTGPEAEALKSACKAAIKTKPGETK